MANTIPDFLEFLLDGIHEIHRIIDDCDIERGFYYQDRSCGGTCAFKTTALFQWVHEPMRVLSEACIVANGRNLKRFL